jgi:hypothetical protein
VAWTLFPVLFVAFVQQGQARSARYFGVVVRGDTFHFGPVGGFLVARVAQNHAVVVEGVEVTFASFVFGHFLEAVKNSLFGSGPRLFQQAFVVISRLVEQEVKHPAAADMDGSRLTAIREHVVVVTAGIEKGVRRSGRATGRESRRAPCG